jgi:cytochrome c-type biogenesis protein
MIPIYLLYFSGGSIDENSGNKRGSVFINALGFVLGFTAVFVALGALASSIGGLLFAHKVLDNIITGAVVVIFGLNYLGVFKIGFLSGIKKIETTIKPLGFFPALLFGLIFAVGWTPCVGAFLGSALGLSANSDTVVTGILLLLVYSLGLGVPFLLSAVLIDRLKGVFGFIKKHYQIVNIICGSLLVIVGILMMTGVMDRMITAFNT